VSEPAKPPVCIVDDDDAVRDALAMVLRTAGHRVEQYSSAEAFVARGRHAEVGCAIVDVRMPGMSGLDLQQRLTSQGIEFPLVFLTGHGDVPMAVLAVKRGALDFLQKPVDDRVLLATVDAALRSHAVREPRPAFDALTRREREVLDLILAGRQTRAIADALHISVKTVEFHRARIHAKLGVSSMVELFRVCHGNPGSSRGS
jgi:FixJ family two-component response regulator